jgi:spore cortex biosynthesis protein YabQ
MHNSLIYELTVFGGAGAAGVLAAFLYDLFRLKRRLIKTGAIVIHIEDVLYWIIATVIIFLASYVVSSGETRFYFFAGVFTGGLLYFMLLSKLVLKGLSVLIKLLVWPVAEVIKLLKPVFLGLAVRIRHLLGKTRNRVALKAYYVKVDFRRFRNVLTKK